MVEILYPKLDRAVIITVLNLDGYYESTIFNSIIRELNTGNTAYIVMKEDYNRVVSAIIYCDEETSKKYKDISYDYWICVEILKRDELEYITEELIHRELLNTDDTDKMRLINYVIKESKSTLNKIYTTTLKNTNLIYVHKANYFLQTPALDTHCKSVAGFSKFGKIYTLYTVDDSENLNEILKEASFYNDQTSSPDDKYIDIKFLTYKGMERYI